MPLGICDHRLVIFVSVAQILAIPATGKAEAKTLEDLMAYRFLLIAVLLLAFADPALANWWIVRAADEKCLVVDIERRAMTRMLTR